MTHRKNRDLKAELAEAQIAAQNWEDRFIEASAEAQRARNLSNQYSRDYDGQSRLVVDLRAELGQASRELMALQASIHKRPVCSCEGEALERELAEVLIELRDDLNESDEFEVTQP